MQSEFKVFLDLNKVEKILLGGSGNIGVNIQNTSNIERVYNVSLQLTLPDGLEVDKVISTPSKVQTSINNTTIVTWENLKDLAPNEIDYIFNIGVKSNKTYKNGEDIPFDTVFSGILLKATCDTMPRGDIDINNSIYALNNFLGIKVTKFLGVIYTSKKVLKGAGSSIEKNDYTKVYRGSFNINSVSSESNINISFLLENGFRYIGNENVIGEDNKYFNSPIISNKVIDEVNYTQLLFSDVTLSQNSSNIFSFDFSVWNKTNNNTGSIIPHGSELRFILYIEQNGIIYEYNYSSVAMDIITLKSANKTVVNIDDKVKYSLYVEAGGYYNIENVTIKDILPDGFKYVSSSTLPDLIEMSQSVNGTLIQYNIKSINVNGHLNISYIANVLENYMYKQDNNFNLQPIVAGDVFINNETVEGSIIELDTNVLDKSSFTITSKIPNITKKLIGVYYRDGLPKNSLIPCENDILEYIITYDATSVNTTQKNIEIFDFFPFAVGPITDLNYVYSGYTLDGITPYSIDPYGIQWNYGNIPQGLTSTIQYKVPVLPNARGEYSTNMVKLNGYNTNNFSYSKRDFVNIDLGQPNLVFTKNISGPNYKSINLNETYTIELKLTNTFTDTSTDAFNFTLSENINGFLLTLDTSSIKVTGSGDFGDYYVENGIINIPINKLLVGENIILTYNLKTNNNLFPNGVHTTTASITKPYSQIYNEGISNYQYNLNKTLTTTYKTPLLTYEEKLLSENLLEVGSNAVFNIKLIVPKGMVLENTQIRTLLSAYVVYTGEFTLNGEDITPRLIGNDTIIFPKISIIDATNSNVEINYTISTLIPDVTINKGDNKTTLTNASSVIWIPSLDPKQYMVSNYYNFNVNHPVLDINLKASNSLNFTGENIVSKNGGVFYIKLSYSNNSLVSIIDSYIEFYLDENVEFISFISSPKNILIFYDPNYNYIGIRYDSINIEEEKSIVFSLKSNNNVFSNTNLIYCVKDTVYNNDISKKLYSAENSNNITVYFPASFSFVPYSSGRVDDSTLYKITPVGSTTTFTNNIINTGNGLDSYNIKINSAPIDYKLYIGNDLVASVSKGEGLNINPNETSNLKPGEMRSLNFTVTIPYNTPLTDVYTFFVTVTSISNPSLFKTIKNIDPFYNKN